ncbi:MAG: mechanosensitive ion channel [Synergistaceae bacterium]|nr:mechanosensitive ion channel [Synergistaceae bacterium]
MTKKILLFLFMLLIIPQNLFAAEQKELAADYVTRMQNEISADIEKLRTLIDTELAEINLTSTDVIQRSKELTALNEKSSDDMASWGYTDEQKELHSQTLSDLGVAYSAYAALNSASGVNPNTPAEIDVSELENIESPDINMSDNLRKEISKVSKGLDVQVFYLQSKLNKLKLDLAEAANLQKKLKGAKEGGEALELPRTQILNLELLRMNVALSRVQVRTLRRAFDSNVATIQRLRRRLADMQEKLIFPQELLDANLEKIQTRINDLTTEMNDARKALDSANSSLVRARATVGSADMSVMTNSTSNYMARSTRVNYWEHMVLLIEDEIALTRESQQIWKDRYKLFHDTATGEELWKIRDTSQARINELQRQLEGVRTAENTILREIETTQASLNAEGITGTVQQNILLAIENKRKIISEIFNRYEALIPNAIFLQQRLNAEANDNVSAIRIAEKVSSFSKDTIMGFLDTELWQGEGYSVTVMKLIIAIFVFLSSFFLSSWGSHWIKRRMLKRFKASITASNAVQRITFYILWVAFALIALNIVKIPLTAFAFMGGAFAVGIGFGMQNIFNNLISGFIVIFSRPFKVNDILDVAGVQGTVEDIGSRSTTIKTWDGFDVILPNRYFLENNVTNWTKTDLRKREVLKVGVSYDCDSREVEKLLLGIVSEHSQVLKNPAPFVIFKNFGDSALEFEIYYWIELRKSSGMKVSSDLRHHISAVFKREGINIPYPQRDIHIIKENDERDKINSQN